jgi:hypothetical protein
MFFPLGHIPRYDDSADSGAYLKLDRGELLPPRL